MALKARIVATGMEFDPDKKTGEAVVLRFRDDNDWVDIVLARNNIPIFLSHFQEETGLGANERLDASTLQKGDMIQLIGRQSRRQPNGHVVLTFHIQTDDGVRSLPIDLAPHDAAELADYILSTA